MLVNDLSVYRITEDNFKRIILQNIPLLDVRSEVEFIKGAIPLAQNIPILNSYERDMVGKTYKRDGQSEAIELGKKLVSGEILAERVARWKSLVQENPQILLYCFRGGLRSQWAQKFIWELSGEKIPRIEGGYKALRKFLQDEIVKISEFQNFIILGGMTGCGKTELLLRLKNEKYPLVIDLEGLAVHKGSAFGEKPGAQRPTQINFENYLARELIRLDHLKHINHINHARDSIYLENESQSIGGIQIPVALYQKMQRSPIIILECSMEERCDFILKDYIWSCFEYHQQNIFQLTEELLASLQKIQRKLGGDRYLELSEQLALAQKVYLNTSSWNGFVTFIEKLLLYYYDPFYLYNQELKKDRVIFRGDREEVMAFIAGSKKL
ncbi:MAG: tRNA 2-selenouridine(34) synthase MnmH [Oligoflexia bacterium]|nr:tRNA 2-selenouridine(34) synthase MnmH [Oligoflexia bacterium]